VTAPTVSAVRINPPMLTTMAYVLSDQPTESLATIAE